MKFNNHELAHLVQNGDFDKEGILQMTERQEGLFRKTDVLVDRLFRLRGNLLFYFRTKEPTSEVLGVFVLERCVPQLDHDEGSLFSFLLVFEGEDKIERFAAHSECARDSWIEHLHIASYECLQLQLQSLREQIRSRTGHDPLNCPEPAVGDMRESHTVRGEPFLEMCIACEGLPCEPSGLEPCSLAMLHYLTPDPADPNTQSWRAHAKTEIHTRSCNPVYLTTIGFDDPVSISMATTVKVTVFNVKERMTNTMTQIGYAEFCLKDLLCASGCQLRLSLTSPGPHQAGHVTLLAWTNTDIHTHDGTEQKNTESVPPALPLRSHTRRIDMLSPLYDNPITKSFRFPTNLGHELSVHEYMAESRLTYYLPRLLLKLWVEEEKKKIEQLQDLGQLAGKEYTDALHKNVTLVMNRLSTYTKQERQYINHAGPPFKPSEKKGHREVEFAPTNLHIHRVWVQNQKENTSACYDTTTVGAFTAYPHKFKHGGLRRLLRELRDHVTEDSDGVTRLERVNAILGRMLSVGNSVDDLARLVCTAAIQADPTALGQAVAELADKTRQLVAVCEDSLVEQGVAEYNAAREFLVANRDRPLSAAFFKSGSPKAAKRNASLSTSPEKNVSWSGTDFVKSTTEEPWELTRSNTEASLIYLTSRVELLLQNDPSPSWLSELSPPVIKLQRCVEVMCNKARSSLTFLTVRECGPNVALMHTIKYRRDVVFSQALTTAVSAFTTQLRSSITNETFLRQLSEIGILMEFEGLLSCHDKEMGMLEDHVVGVNDLSLATFRVRLADSASDVLPTVEGNRTGYTVVVPLPETTFRLLPLDLQRGHKIHIVPVLFNIGINETATLAETFGGVSLQHAINEESFQKLYQYYERFSELYGEPGQVGRNSVPLEQLMKHLHVSVMNKKPKNVDVLQLAAEVCRKMRGLRSLSCKSAKDRTAMGVTLECVQILQKEHDLASHVFLHALECLRSEGVRRENTQKNTGRRKYAFNSVQILSFPKLYRAPNGTYGNVTS